MVRSIITALAAAALLAGCVEERAQYGGPTLAAMGATDAYVQPAAAGGDETLVAQGSALEILDADYGERGRYCNAARRIGRECNGRRDCDISVGNHLCNNDPAPGIVKELRLRFACEGRRRSDEDWVRAREGQRIRLECERGRGEAYVSGRPGPGGPGYGPGPGPGPGYGGRSDIRVVDARYGAQGRDCNATGAVASRCNGQDRCSVRADNNLCGDPAFGQPKALVITYLCRGSQRNAMAREGQRADLGC